MRYLIPLALFATCLSIGSVLCAEGDEDSYLRIHDEVFNTKEAIEPEKTLELLRKLENIYSKKPAAFFARRKKVMILIEASENIPGKCYYKRSVNNFLRLFEEYKATNAINILKYLEHFRDQQLIVCEKLLAKYLKEEVARLDDQDKKSIEQLRSSIVEANDGIDFEDSSTDIPREAVEEGAREYLQQQVPESENDEVAINIMFGYAFDRLIVQLCGWTKRGADSMLEIIELLAGKEHKASIAVDRFTVKWITNVRMCRQIAN